MSVDLAGGGAVRAGWRLDRAGATRARPGWVLGAAGAAALAWATWGTLGLDLGDADARLAMAAAQGIGPHGKVFGSWDPTVRPGPLAASAVAAWVLGEDGAAWPGVVHLPRLIAWWALAALVGGGIRRVFGRALGLAVGLGLATCLVGVDRTPGFGIDVWTALALGVFTDQLLRRGATWTAGSALGLGFLLGGLPPVVLGLGLVIVLGRRGAYLNLRLLAPTAAIIAGWSAWALKTAPAAAWAVSLLGPLRQPMAWWSVPAAIGLGLPWSPMLGLLASRTLRGRWSAAQAALVAGWGQAAVVAGLAGSLVPGCGAAGAAWLIVAIVVLGIVAFGTGVREVGRVGAAARWLGAGVCVAWVVVALPALVGLAALVAYYRELALGLAIAATFGMAYGAVGAWTRRPAWVVGGVAAVAVGIAVAYAGIYAPERAYRTGQGPWGRSIGQWVPPMKAVHVFHEERAALMHAVGRPVRQLVAPAWLGFLETPGPHYVLLLASEYAHWPPQAPAIEKVREFTDQSGTTRVLARTLETGG